MHGGGEPVVVLLSVVLTSPEVPDELASDELVASEGSVGRPDEDELEVVRAGPASWGSTQPPARTKGSSRLGRARVCMA